MSGGAVASKDARDTELRKLSLRSDRTDGSSVGTAPRATRTVEVLAEPLARSPFKRILLLDQSLNMSGGGWIDSFDSGDTTKSTNGLYDVAKRQSNGNIVINDSTGTDLASISIYGNLGYKGPQAEKAAELASERLGPDANFQALFREALKALRTGS